MFGHAVKTFSHATLGAAAATLAIGLTGAPPAAAVEAQSLVGAWSGPPTMGDTDDCAPPSAEFAFSPNGGYRYLAVDPNCGMVVIDGHYELQADGGVLQLTIDPAARLGRRR